MEHQSLEKMSSTAPMLENKEDKVVFLATKRNGVPGKILLREDTILASSSGCACGQAQFTCGGGVKYAWPALCWGKYSASIARRQYCFLVALSTVFAFSLFGSVLLLFTDIVHDTLMSGMVLKNNSMAFEMWRRPTVQPLMKVHIFNYTNWDKVRSGAEEKLTVVDVGPYVYAQQTERVNIDFREDTLSFQDHNNYTFLPELSTGTQIDTVVVPNLPLLALISIIKEKNIPTFALLPVLLGVKRSNHPNAFNALPVHRFLWGYDDSLIDAAKPLLSLLGKLDFTQFGLLVSKNGTVKDRLTINTGENDIKRINMIEAFDGQDRLQYWNTAECNSIEASDGSLFSPSILDQNTTLNVFMPRLCRRLPFNYDKDVETPDGIKLYRYRMPRNVFDDPELNPANQCYCDIDLQMCPPRGVINVTKCTGVPSIVSFPHFHLGDPKLRSKFEGLHPNPDLHESYVDIHPRLGIALNGKSSLQLNFQIKRHHMFDETKFLDEDLILPVAWLDMVVEDLPENVKSLVYHGTYSAAALHLGLTVFCILGLALSGVGLLAILLRRHRKPCATLKLPMDTNVRPGF